MKDVKILSRFSLALIVIVLSMWSCSNDSKEQTDDTISNLTFVSRDAMKKYHNDVIMKSSLYFNFQYYAEELSRNIDNLAVVPLEKRSNYENWCIANLNQTRFRSVGEALNLYDAAIAASSLYYNDYKSFYAELSLLSDQDIRYVIQDGFVPSPPANATSSCEVDCDVRMYHEWQDNESWMIGEIRKLPNMITMIATYSVYRDAIEDIFDRNDACRDAC